MQRSAEAYGDGEGVRTDRFTFTGARPVDGQGNPSPLSLSGMVPASFAVGGPNHPAAQVVEVTLNEIQPDSLVSEDGRWLASFSNVPAGEYTVQATTKDGSVDTLPLIISETVTDEGAACGSGPG
jgi:hypothetical protein